MKNAVAPFLKYLDEIDDHLTYAKTQINPALALSETDVRTSTFRLQALARLYRKLHNKKTFNSINIKVKQVEDALGAIDHYSVLEKEFAPDKKVPAHIKHYFTEKRKEKTDLFNKLLVAEKWLSGKRSQRLRKRLKKVEWMKPTDEIDAIRLFFTDVITGIHAFIQACSFADMENDVHELRRKIRWISIYAMSLQGKVNLVTKEKPEPHLKKYLTPKIIKSPFNKITGSPEFKKHVELNKNNFLALSWLIAEIGDLKDEGLMLTALQEAYVHTEKITEAEAIRKAYAVLDDKQATLEELLKKAQKITHLFTKEQILDNLVIS